MGDWSETHGASGIHGRDIGLTSSDVGFTTGDRSEIDDVTTLSSFEILYDELSEVNESDDIGVEYDCELCETRMDGQSSLCCQKGKLGR